MTNTNELKGKIVACGLTQEQTARALSISLQSFSLKLHCKKEFKGKEIQALISLLKISSNELMSIFFTNNSELKSLKKE